MTMAMSIARRQTEDYQYPTQRQAFNYTGHGGRGDNEKEGTRLNFYVVACTMLASLSSILLGYDVGVMSGAVLFIQEDMKVSRTMEEVLIGSLNMVAVFGAALSGFLSDAVGRRRTIIAASLMFFLGAVIMSVAQTLGMLLAGRVIMGIGTGVGLLIAPLYTAELSPHSLRGSLVSVNEICINLGILLGYAVSYMFSGMALDTGWRWMLGIGAVPAFALGCGAFVLPESPRWLVMKRRINEAEEILSKISRDGKEAEARLKDIQEALGLGSLGQPSADGKSSRIVNAWSEILAPTRPLRKMLVLVIGTNFFQMACGIEAAVYYSPTIFAEAGIDADHKQGLLAATVLVGGLKTVFIVIAVLYLDKFGRRPMMLVSTIGVTCSLIVEAIAFLVLNTDHQSKGTTLPVRPTSHHDGIGFQSALAVGGICAFVSFFSVGLGPINWVITAEIFPLRIRAQAMVLGVIVNRLISGVIAITFLSLLKAIKPAGVFFAFAVMSFFATLFFFFLLPETKGITLEQIEMLFGDPDPSDRNILGGGHDFGSGRNLRSEDPLVGGNRGWADNRPPRGPMAHPLPAPPHPSRSVIGMSGPQDYDISLNVWMAENRDAADREMASMNQGPLLPMEIPRSSDLSIQKH